MYDRRQDDRVKLNLEARWEGALAQCGGLIVDLSKSGCFILTSDRVTHRELVHLELQPPVRAAIHVWGEVVYQVPEMGFALRFVEPGGSDAAALAELIELVRESEGAPATA